MRHAEEDRLITSDGSIKPWRDMTPDERQRDRLRHFPKMLAKWRGARATMWELTISHKTLVIRLERSGSSDNLHLSCGPVHIRGPVTWGNCDLEVSLAESGMWLIKDVVAGVEVIAENVEIAENCKPVYVAG